VCGVPIDDLQQFLVPRRLADGRARKQDRR
jgi:hypothetical protein